MQTEVTPVGEFWHAHGEGAVRCELCPQRCVIAEGKRGICHARGCVDGRLHALAYGRISAANMDPIEKKPLYHFHPGSGIYSIGGWGCNLRCVFCQNWRLSQHVEEAAPYGAPEDRVKAARAGRAVGIAYTYNEPLIAIEYVTACAALCRRAGLLNVLVTNGFVNRDPAARILPLIDALNIDIKSMEDRFYAHHCGGRLEPVLLFARQAREAGCHVEITNLVIPGLNDTDALLEELAGWVSTHLGRCTPLHLSAYFPRYKLQTRATTAALLEHAHALCRRQLDYVYIGNVGTEHGQDTSCPQCGTILVRRQGYCTDLCGITNGACAKCRRPADLVV